MTISRENKKLFWQITPNEKACLIQSDSPFAQLPTDIHRHIFSPYISNKDKMPLRDSCKLFYQTYSFDIALTSLLEAVIDNNQEKVKRILNTGLDVLVITPEVFVIESKKTWQRFYAELPLKMAIKLRQIEMIKILLGYFKLVPNGLEIALAQWQEAEQEMTQRPNHYDFSSLWSMIRQETFPITENVYYMINRISIPLTKLLCQFREEMLPTSPLYLNDYYDIELILQKAYLSVLHESEKGRHTLSKDQYNIFFICVIGFLQSLLPSEFEGIISSGFYNHYLENQADTLAPTPLVQLNAPFYREDKNSWMGLGFEYFFTVLGTQLEWRNGLEEGVYNTLNGCQPGTIFKELLAQRKNEMEKLKEEVSMESKLAFEM